MNFVSKHANLQIVLKHGIPSDRATGRSAINGLYVRFVDGFVNVEDKQTIELMLNHDGYKKDFETCEEEGVDPYAKTRKESEPAHNIGEIEHGSVGKGYGTSVPVKFTPQQEKVIEELVKIKAKELLLEMAKKQAELKDTEPTPPVEEDKKEETKKDQVVEETKSKDSVTKKK